MPGGAGEFVGPIAVSVMLALGASLMLSLTVVPALTALAEERLPWLNRISKGWLAEGYRNRELAKRYEGFLRWSFAQPWRGVALAMVLPVLGFYAATRLSEQFFPPAEREQFQIQLRLPQEASIRLTTETTQKARALLLEDPAVVDVHWFAGKNAPKFYYNMLAGDDGSAFYAQAMVELKSVDGYFETINRLQRKLNQQFPESQFVARQLEQGPPFAAPVELYLYGEDFQELHAWGERLRGILAEVPGVTHTKTTLEDGLPKLSFVTNDTELRLAGLDPRSVAGQMQSNLEGAVGGSLLEATEQLAVKVRVRDEERATVGGVSSIHLLGSGAQSVPATAVGSFDLVPVVAAINRRDGVRVNKIQGFVEAGLLPSVLLKEFENRIAAEGLKLPSGMRIEVGGEAKERNDAVGNLLSSIGILVVLMVATLVLSLRSFRLTAMIFAIAGLSAGTGFLGLWIFGYPFGFTAITGIMGLIGLAINTAIIVLAGIQESPMAAAGNRQAIRAVVMRNTRHILATTLTTLIGFVPLLAGGGGFWPPMALAICGGVTGGTLLGLLFAPSVYLLLRRDRRAETAAEAKDLAVQAA
jgi:multidrug efflux pump subunit AcrB